MSTVRFSAEFMREEILDTVSIVEDNIVDHHRWSVEHELIFKHLGVHYKTSYFVGATESQFQSPWEEDEFVDCIVVESRVVEVDQWVEVDENATIWDNIILDHTKENDDES